MSRKKIISKLRASSVFPTGNESMVPEPAEIKIFHSAHGHRAGKIRHQGKFRQTINPIRQPGGKTPNRN
jgi:hypothetical protein